MFRKKIRQADIFSELKPERILTTLSKLCGRIEEQFPGSGLGRVAKELHEVALSIVQLMDKLCRPLWVIRILTALAILAILGLAFYVIVLTIRFIPAGESGLVDLLQGTESAINELIFLTLAILFLATIEIRYKRKMAQNSLHQLRSIAHVVDMHQLTKDPAFMFDGNGETIGSTKRTMSPYELTRYLDFCSELLAITSKLAALHAQSFQDSQVLTSVNEVESLAHGLASKIWQKIMILDRMVSGGKKE